jgi:hypothetical protein
MMTSDHIFCKNDPQTLLEHCCSTMTDEISATMTYVMWFEEHLWDVSVLERVHISKLILI